MTDVLDLAPALRRKRLSECKHEHASVDDSAASLTCDDCDAEIDPWWWLRRSAEDDRIATEWYEAQRKAHEEWMVRANVIEADRQHRIDRLDAQIRQLEKRKEALLATLPARVVTRRRSTP